MINFLSAFCHEHFLIVISSSQTMLQELSSRKRTVENFKDKVNNVASLIKNESMLESADDIVNRYGALVSNLNETINTNEKALENAQQIQTDLKSCRDNLKHLWETLSEYTSKF